MQLLNSLDKCNFIFLSSEDKYYSRHSVRLGDGIVQKYMSLEYMSFERICRMCHRNYNFSNIQCVCISLDS